MPVGTAASLASCVCERHLKALAESIDVVGTGVTVERRELTLRPAWGLAALTDEVLVKARVCIVVGGGMVE